MVVLEVGGATTWFELGKIWLCKELWIKCDIEGDLGDNSGVPRG